ncbi:hypothetical protein [Sporosarcina sp. FSL W7-1283]|uniref:hypothetical protein n=1 Tax=Sporosarcina sp. FSL W7-1283 TaxID=2921560 RepID=UPI0030F55C32
MRDYKKKEVTITKSRLQKVVCNKCGKHDDAKEGINLAHYQEIGVSFGYGSDYDMQSWKFDLCEECLVELVKTFKIIPEGFGQDSYYAKYPKAMFEHWKETGEVNLEAGMTSEEIEARGGSIYVEDGDVYGLTNKEKYGIDYE